MLFLFVGKLLCLGVLAEGFSVLAHRGVVMLGGEEPIWLPKRTPAGEKGAEEDRATLPMSSEGC